MNAYVLQTLSPWPGKALKDIPREELKKLFVLRKAREHGDNPRKYREHAREDMKAMEKYLYGVSKVTMDVAQKEISHE